MKKVIYNLNVFSTLIAFLIICYVSDINAQQANNLKIVSSTLPSTANMNEMLTFKGYVKNISNQKVATKELEINYYTYSKSGDNSRIKSKFAEPIIGTPPFIAPGDSVYFEHQVKVSPKSFEPSIDANQQKTKNVIIIWPVELKTNVWSNAVNPIKHVLIVKGENDSRNTTPHN